MKKAAHNQRRRNTMKFNLQSKLGAWALIALLCLAVVPTVGCSGTTVAQDIVNWTPTIISAAQTVDATLAALDPAQAGPIIGVGQTFVAGATLVDAQAKTYLANPSATALQQLQAQALAFQANVSTALLQAAHITNAASQQKILSGLNAAVTGISAILALISTVKGSTISPASVTAPKLSSLGPVLDERQQIAIVAGHYGEPEFLAAYQVRHVKVKLQQAGF
jgi:hypothetical protein